MYAGNSSSNPLFEEKFRQPSPSITAVVYYLVMFQHAEGDDLVKHSILVDVDPCAYSLYHWAAIQEIL